MKQIQVGSQNIQNVKMKNVAIYSIIFSLSLLVPINPFVIQLVLHSRSTAIYAGLIDLYALAVVFLAFLYIIYQRKFLSHLLIASFINVIPTLFIGEAIYVYFREVIGDQILGIEKSRYMQANPVSLYSPIPNAVGNHVSPGNYNVIYNFDEKGRKKIEQNSSTAKTLHFFGDSFTFGYGVSNDDTALNLLAKKINDRYNVQNYGVGGYSIELMYLRLLDLIHEVKPGDVVVFSPISIDLSRGLPGKSRACRLVLGKDGFEVYPRLIGGEVNYLKISEECNFILDTLLSNTTFEFSIGRFYKSVRDWVNHQKIINAADEIFAEAKGLARSRGANFHVIFFTTPSECTHREYSLSLEGLVTSHATLLPYCPRDPQVLKTFHFPSDDHWSPLGNQWAADALYEILQVLKVID